MKGSFEQISDIKQIQNLMKSVGWNPRTKKQWTDCLQNSFAVYSSWEKEELIGFGRLVTDKKYAMVYDLVVHPQYQNKGIGKKIVSELVKKCPKGTSIGLFIEDKDSLKSFYKSLGFEPIQGMQLKK